MREGGREGERGRKRKEGKREGGRKLTFVSLMLTRSDISLEDDPLDHEVEPVEELNIQQGLRDVNEGKLK